MRRAANASTAQARVSPLAHVTQVFLSHLLGHPQCGVMPSHVFGASEAPSADGRKEGSATCCKLSTDGGASGSGNSAALPGRAQHAAALYLDVEPIRRFGRDERR